MPTRSNYLQAAIAGLVAALASVASAQDMHAKISSLECYEDEALIVHVEIENPRQASAPTPEATDDFTIRLVPGIANPAHQSVTTFINGRHSAREMYTYYFELLPTRTGQLTVPAFTRFDSGKAHSTRPINVTVRPRTGARLVFAKVLAERTSVFVGEPVQLKLEIWVRKFSQPRIGTLDANSTWVMGINGASQLGLFAQLAANPTFREETVTEADNSRNGYIVYTLETTARPEKPGEMSFDDIVIAWNYPVELARALLRRYEHVQQPRNLRISPEAPRLTVKAVPTENRPPDYNGAIGQFSMRAAARPTSVPVGDPITLTLTVSGDVPLDQLSAPRLSQVKSLISDFSISDDSLAGEVRGDRKHFTLTIRALREDVKQIPPIPFSYFNPRNEKFETVHSQAIPLDVLPPKRVALLPLPNDVHGEGERRTLSETTDGLLANVADTDQLMADHRGGFGVASKVFLGAMPCFYLVAWLVTRRQDRLRADGGLRRRVFAYNRARRALKTSGGSDGLERVYAALTGYVADRCNVPAAGLTRQDAVRLLEARGVPAETRTRLDQLLEQIEYSRYAGGTRVVSSDVEDSAMALLRDLEQVDLQ